MEMTFKLFWPFFEVSEQFLSVAIRFIDNIFVVSSIRVFGLQSGEQTVECEPGLLLPLLS